MDLYQLIYQSQSLVPFETPELTTLLQKARAYNHTNGITGILLYTPDGRFLQVLEGTREAVRHLFFNCVVADPRHYNWQVLSEGPCQERSFSDWTMGFRMAQTPFLRKLLGHVPPENLALFVSRRRTRPELLALLLDFVGTREAETHPERPASQ